MGRRFKFLLMVSLLFVFGLFYGFLLYLHGPLSFLTQFATTIFAPALLPIIVFAYLAYKVGNKVIVIVVMITSIIVGYLIGLLIS